MSEIWLCHVSGGCGASSLKANRCALVEVYTAVLSMSNMLEIKFSFPRSVNRQRTISFPEVQLMALVVVAVKMYYPFDELKRYAETLEEPGVVTIDWDVWGEEHAKYRRRATLGGKLGLGNAIKVKETDVFAMSEREIDEYLDWYERMWVKDGNQGRKKSSLPTELLDMFPTGGVDDSPAFAANADQAANADGEALVSKLRTVQASLKFRGFISEESQRVNEVPIWRLGNLYKRYRKEEELPSQGKVFFEAAADLVGLSLHRMMLAVFQTEQKLLHFRGNQVRKSRETSSGPNAREAFEGDIEAMEVVRNNDDGDSFSVNSDVEISSNSTS